MPTLAERFTPADSPYGPRRLPAMAPRGMVAASQTLAATAGLSALRRGGTAADAAVVVAAALTVLEPTTNGIGGDAFALVWDGGRLHGLNGSGRAPEAHTPEAFRARGLAKVPPIGWLSVTVPGAPAAWRDLHARFGRLPFPDLLEPAIRYAEHGFPVAPWTADLWARATKAYAAALKGAEYRDWFPTFAPGGAPPPAGGIWRSPGHARTLRAIARSRADDFYRGGLAREVAAFAKETGGLLTADDLARHESTWVDPIRTTYRGFDVWEVPPNNQGVAALTALNLLEGFDVAKHARDSAESFHVQVECMKVAFADAYRYVGDPARAAVPTAGLLDKAYAAERRSLVGDRAGRPGPGSPPNGGTVYFCTADADGQMVSFIQSNYRGFGCGIVVPGTGIALQDRGECFSLEAGHPNEIAPGKRPFHTIMPGFLSSEGTAIGPFGVMGGAMQPQGHVQMVVNQVDYGMDPQASLDAPRWQWTKDLEVLVEEHAAPSVVPGLVERGHAAKSDVADVTFGRGQVIRRLGNGSYAAGSDFRADGCAVGY
jgi:gamma-glutamyltranspeptidase/glutathione hydrolase